MADFSSVPRRLSSPKTIVPRQRLETKSPLLPSNLNSNSNPPWLPDGPLAPSPYLATSRADMSCAGNSAYIIIRAKLRQLCSRSHPAAEAKRCCACPIAGNCGPRPPTHSGLYRLHQRASRAAAYLTGGRQAKSLRKPLKILRPLGRISLECWTASRGQRRRCAAASPTATLASIRQCTRNIDDPDFCVLE